MAAEEVMATEVGVAVEEAEVEAEVAVASLL